MNIQFKRQSTVRSIELNTQTTESDTTTQNNVNCSRPRVLYFPLFSLQLRLLKSKLTPRTAITTCQPPQSASH